MLLRFSSAVGLILLVVGLAGCASEAVPQPAATSRDKTTSASSGDPIDLADVIAPVIAQARIPGAAAVVLRGDRVIAEGFAGVRKFGATEPITIHDQFEICSCAKAMTATVVARFIEQGKLNWDTSVADLFRDAVPVIDPAWKNVTVRQALMHRAGLKDHLLSFAWSMLRDRSDASTQRLNYLAKVLRRPPDFVPGTAFLYNNTDYVLLGAALEKLTGRSWDDLMSGELFQPLGMNSGGFGPPGTPGKIDQPWGHGGQRLFYVPLGGGSTPFDPGDRDADFPMMGAPAGWVHLTMRDWAKSVTLHLRGDPANPHHTAALLKPETFARLHEGQDYAAGWFTGTRPWARGSRPGGTGRVLFHQGDNGRWNSVVYVAPEIDFAVLIACNRAAMWRPLDEIAGKLVGRFAKLEE